ncbi:FecR family protein [Labilibacter sediminis]|nr:FecR family protein [Labilibacter sediminis]
MTNEDKIKRWLSGELSDSERAEFESSEEFGKIDKLLKAVNSFKAPEYDVEKEYNILSDNLSYNRRSISLYEKVRPVLRIAAIFIIALTIGYFTYTNFNSPSEKQGWVAEQGEIFLPDSSSLILNAASKIRFSEKGWEKGRDVELSGEAFFMVKKGESFNVITPQGTVTVLGTQFGVKDRDNYYEVICYSGSVKVVSGSMTRILKAGAAFRIINGIDDNFIVSNKKEPDWIKGESSFNSTPISFVFKELERQYKVKVEFNNVDLNQLFTGSFTNSNLKIALESITIPVNLRYEIKGNKIVINLEDR